MVCVDEELVRYIVLLEAKRQLESEKFVKHLVVVR